jgi:hypothetical protein
MKVSCIFAHFDFPLENPRTQNRNFQYTTTLAVIKKQKWQNQEYLLVRHFMI